MASSPTAAAAKASSKTALHFRVLAECSTTKARASVMSLPHADVLTPVFMPVGTQGTLKVSSAERSP